MFRGVLVGRDKPEICEERQQNKMRTGRVEGAAPPLVSTFHVNASGLPSQQWAACFLSGGDPTEALGVPPASREGAPLQARTGESIKDCGQPLSQDCGTHGRVGGRLPEGRKGTERERIGKAQAAAGVNPDGQRKDEVRLGTGPGSAVRQKNEPAGWEPTWSGSVLGVVVAKAFRNSGGTPGA